MKKIIFMACSLLAIFAASLSTSATSPWKEKAEAEGKVVWYTTIGATDCKMLSDRFMEQYPKIEVQCYRTGGPQIV